MTCMLLLCFAQFMDLRTRYTALVTLMTQYVKFASETLRRTEDEEVRFPSVHNTFFFLPTFKVASAGHSRPLGLRDRLHLQCLYLLIFA